MEENSFILDLLGALDQAKSQKQINEDIKQLEKTINMLRITGTFARGNTKKELNAYIKSLQSQLNYVKLNAKIDDKNLKHEIDSALNKVSFKDIDALKIDGSKTKLKLRKVIADTKEFVEKNPISVGINYENRRNKLDNDLTTYLNRNTKIEESATLLKEAENVRTLIGAINDKKSLREATDAFQLYKSSVASVGFNTKSTTDKIKSMLGQVSKLGSTLGIASMAVNHFVRSMKTLRENDTILTEISKTSELTKQQLRELGDEAFKTAGKYGQLSSNYLLAVQEMARSGYEDASRELGELSLLTQSAGDMTADSANNYLLATDAAYKYSGSVEKLNAALDGANFISNRNSASLTDIADATRVSASFAANAGVAIDELTAAEATMIATTKRSGSEIGRAFRSIVLNLQQVSGEFDGEVIDEEQLKKVESRCHSMGVELEYMKDGIATLRNPMEVLKELAAVYNSLPDSSADKQGLISDLGGKYHANALSALLSRWDIYEKMLGEFSQGTGSALEEAEKTADSWEGRLHSLQNSFDSFVNTLTDKEAVKGGVTFFDRLIQGAEGFIDIFGELPTVLTAVNSSMVALNKDYGVTQVWNKDKRKIDIQGEAFGINFTAAKNLKKHFSEAEDAIAKWNSRLVAGKVDINDFDDALAKNNVQFRTYLQTTSKEAPASLAGYKASLNAAGISTDALRIKTILLNSAISMGIGIAIQAAAQGIAYLIQREENLRQATEDAANAYKESSSSIKDYVSRYEELHKALIAAKGNEEETYNIKKQLLELQTELNDRFGDEYGALNLVTEAYKDQTDAIKALNKETAQTFLNENEKGIRKATDQIEKERHYNLSYTGMIATTEKGSALKEVAEKYADQGVTLLDESDDGVTFSVHLKTDAQSAYDTINAFETDIRDKAAELGDEHMFDDVLEISSGSLNKAKTVLDEYGEIYDRALMAEIATDDSKAEKYNEAVGAVEAYNEAVLRAKDPYDDQNVMKAKEDLEQVRASIQENEEEWGKYATLFEKIFEQADTRLIDFNERLQDDASLKKLAENLNGMTDLDLQALNPGENASFDGLRESAESYGIEVNDLITALVRLGYVQGEVQNKDMPVPEVSPLSISQTIDQLNTQLKPAFDSLKAAYQDIFTDDGFTLKNVDTDMLSSIKKAIDDLNESGEVSIDYSAFEGLATALTSSTASADSVHEAMNAFATDLISSLNPALSQCSGENYILVQNLLNSLGVMNSEEVMVSTLGYSYGEYIAAKEEAAVAGLDLAVATESEINAFVLEALEAGTCGEALALLQLKKALINQTTITTAGDCSNILALAKAADIGVEHLERLNTLMNLISKRDSAHASGDARAVTELNNAIRDFSANVVSDLNFEDIKVDFSGIGNSAKSAAKETKKEVDVMAELNSEMDKLQSAYESLCDIRDTYNQYGKITVDQYQQLTDMGFNFLANLVDENGELGLNASAFEKLSQAKIQEMQIQMARNAIDTINGLKSETEAVEYLTYANENLRDAALSATEALLYQAQAAAHLRGEQQGLAADQIVQGYEASKLLASKVDFTFKPDTKEKTEKAAKEDKTDKLLDAYNDEKKLLDHLLTMDQISKQEYYDRLFALVHKYFDGDEEHKDQVWDVEEEYHKYLESIKKTYNWIETFLNALAKKANALIDKADKFISWSKKNAMINRAVKATDKEITGQMNAYAYYAEQARKVKLSNEYINKIQNGTLTMEDMQNEKLSNKIEKYQEWYDKMTECQDAVSTLYDQERDLIKQKLDNVLDYYDSLDSYMSSIVSKMDSFISLMDDMGKRSSLTDLLEQFAAANEQLSHFNSKSENIQIEKEDTRFDSSKKVAEAKERDKQEAIDELNRQKEALTAVQDTGTYKKLLKEIAKAEAAYDKQYEKLWAIDPDKDPEGKKWDAAQKKLDKLSDKLSDLMNKKEELLASATSGNIVEYSRLYDAYMKLYNKRSSLEEKGKELSQKDQDKMDALFDQMLEMDSYRKDVVKELEEQIGKLNGTVADDAEAEKIKERLSGISSGVKDSATYKNLEKDILKIEEKIERFWETHDGATDAQQKQLDRWEAQLEAYYEKQKQLEENATAETVGQYNKIYDAWKKLQDKLDAGKVLSVKEWKDYDKYGEQLKQFAQARADAEKDLEDQLEKALNPGDKIAVINREYEEAAEGIYESYQKQIGDIKRSMADSQQYKDLLAKKQNLENIRDTKGLTAKQEKLLEKYTAELEALEQGGTGDNISDYIQTWEKWYALQQKLDGNQKLSSKEAADYDALKAQLDAWDREKQTQISDLISLMEDDLEKLREKNAENLAEAEAEINNYYSNIYGLAKKIAEYNITALEDQLSCLDAFIGYYKELVSLYDSFSGEKLDKLLSDLDEDVAAGQTELYEKYLKTLGTKYDTILAQINEYKQLIDAVDTNDFQGSMDLFQKAMDSYNAAGNTEMADKLKAVLDVLNERAVDADNWGEYADLWLNEWEQALADGKAELIGTADAIQEINDALREIKFSGITDALEDLTKANEILSSMEGLIQEKWLYDKEGITEYGRAKAALLVSQLENAQAAAEKYLELYSDIIDSKDTYASDKAYKEALNEAVLNYYSSLNDAASLEESIMDLMKKSEERELSSLKDIIDARKKALQAKKNYYDYGKKVADSQKEIDSIRAQIDALENLSDATDAATKAKLAQLKAELEEKENALQETKDDHTYNLKVDALDELADTLTDALDDSTKSIKEVMKDYQETVEATKDMCKESIDSVNETMDKITAFYKGMGMSVDGIDLTLNGKGSLGSDMLEPAIGRADAKNDIVEAVNETTEAVLDIDKLIADGEWTLAPDNLIYGMDGKTYEMPDWNTMPKLNYDVEKMFPSDFLKQQQVVNQVNQPVVNIHYDNMINVEGSVDKNFAKEWRKDADKLYNDFISRMKYGFELTGGRPIRFIG